MSTTTTETAQINGDTSYSPKFLPKVTSIPVVNSLKNQLFAHVPQAESLSKHVGEHLSAVFTYTNDTPIQPMLIRLDALAADGVARLEKEVPIVTTPTEEVLRKTKIDRFICFFTHHYVTTVDFIFNLFNAYKGVFDPVVDGVLNNLEVFLGIQNSKDESQKERVAHIRGVIIEKVDSHVTPILNKTRETVASIYSNKITPLAQYRLEQFNTRKDKAAETYSPVVSELASRYTKAESAAKDAWVKTKPDISGPNAVIPSLKSGIFVVITFGYNLVFPESNKSSPQGVEEQTNGLVSGIELKDGDAKKRPNGLAL
jgi:hypothetical protein